MARVLVVDDEAAQRGIISSILKADGYTVVEASGVDAALVRIEEEQPGVVITDLKMDNRSGLELVEAIAKMASRPEVVVMTAFGSIDTSVRAMKLGAYDYLTKPLEREELLLVVARALEKFNLRADSVHMRDEIARQSSQGFVAESTVMRGIMDMAKKVALSDATVLILGESGTGKERIARFIHLESGQGSRPLQAINCAAFPETLLESELFGYEKGSFTGAQARKIGIIESTSGSTLFLDEVADMSLNTQAKLLRVLQEKEIRRVGGTAAIPVEIRVIAATNKNLEELIKKGLFREDLFYRLSVIPIIIPPLRERPADIPPLVQFFINRRQKKKKIAEDALRLLCEYRWPGNIRELEAVVERMIILSAGEIITVNDLPVEIKQKQNAAACGPMQLPEQGIVLEDWEKSMIEQALARSQGVIADAARLLGVTYRTLQYRAAKFGLIQQQPGQE
jgi:DNA-binding NtrC family response regulator